jgi:hypothetical protein
MVLSRILSRKAGTPVSGEKSKGGNEVDTAVRRRRSQRLRSQSVNGSRKRIVDGPEIDKGMTWEVTVVYSHLK